MLFEAPCRITTNAWWGAQIQLWKTAQASYSNHVSIHITFDLTNKRAEPTLNRCPPCFSTWLLIIQNYIWPYKWEGGGRQRNSTIYYLTVTKKVNKRRQRPTTQLGTRHCKGALQLRNRVYPCTLRAMKKRKGKNTFPVNDILECAIRFLQLSGHLYCIFGPSCIKISRSIRKSPRGSLLLPPIPKPK